MKRKGGRASEYSWRRRRRDRGKTGTPKDKTGKETLKSEVGRHLFLEEGEGQGKFLISKREASIPCYKTE